MLELQGKLKKTIIVNENFVEIKQSSLLRGKSDKKIPINKISSVEVKKPGLMAGFIQISELGANKNKGFSSGAYQAAGDENSVMFSSSSDYQKALEIKEFIEQQMTKNTNPQVITQQVSAADEIQKFKNLLDQGIISQEDFEAKKKQLLGI